MNKNFMTTCKVKQSPLFSVLVPSGTLIAGGKINRKMKKIKIKHIYTHTSVTCTDKKNPLTHWNQIHVKNKTNFYKDV